MNDQEQLAVALRIGGLIYKYLSENITDDELTELHIWAYTNKANQELFEEIKYSGEFQESMKYVAGIDKEAAFRSIQDKIAAQEVKVVRLPVNRWRYIVAAASIILLMSGTVGIYLLMHNKTGNDHLQAAQLYKNDIGPGGDKAVLTLSNGSTIVLDNAQNGTLAQQGNAKVLKLASGQLAYTVTPRIAGTFSYNTLSTPRGGQYQVELPDRTKVWLNNASSLRYPTSFIGSNREVELTGEAYFEVAHNSSKPFRVKTQTCTVEDIGTSFNVMAYKDEEFIKTTLVRGSVKISQPVGGGDRHRDVILIPGQQAQVEGGNYKEGYKINVVNEVDVDRVIAWKNDYFNFDRADLRAVMRQLSRWYDVDVQYEGNITNHYFDGRIQRKLLLSKVLNGLENSEVHFSIEGRKIRVTP